MHPITALSGITGSISIASWVVVFSPQIVENFRRSSAEGLSIVFIVVWLAGDVFNILGAVLQGVLPTMIILAVYYTLADIVLLLQCWYYRGFTLKDPSPSSADTSSTTGADSAYPAPTEDQTESTHPSQPQLKPNSSTSAPSNERTALLTHHSNGNANSGNATSALTNGHTRRGSFKDHLQPFQSNDAPRFSPAQPMHRPSRDEAALKARSPVHSRRPLLHSILFNVASILVVCAAGVLGWYLSTRTSSHPHHDGHHGTQHGTHHGDTIQRPDLHFNLLGQVFGYICAILYLGSRLPQLLLNYRRKSTDGLSLLFFLFACIGNLTYVLSILAYEPVCERRYEQLAGAAGGAGHSGFVGSSGEYGEVWGARYCTPSEARAQYGKNLAINASWLIGSFGTLLLDAGVFVQYYIYRKKEEESAVEDEGHGGT